MNIINIEVKAPTKKPDAIIDILIKNNAVYHGEDHQIDTYFSVETGRLKLRQGNIESSLIAYQRPESKDLKKSTIELQPLPKNTDALLHILSQNLGIWKVVDKHRKIFFIDNVKFHVDAVKGLGSFVEIEAISIENKFDEKELEEQCQYYIDLLGLDRSSFIDKSYSDMV